MISNVKVVLLEPIPLKLASHNYINVKIVLLVNIRNHDSRNVLFASLEGIKTN